MKLVCTPPRYPPFTGGVENVSHALALRLDRAGDEILVICADVPRNSPSNVEGVSVLRIKSHFNIANTNITLGLPWALLRGEWEVIQTDVPTPWSADWSVLIARLLGRGSVIAFYNEIVGTATMNWVAKVYQQTVFRLTLRLTDKILVVSDRWRDYLLSINSALGPKIHVVPTGVDVAQFHPIEQTETGNTLLFVGVLDRFHRYKGLDVLLHAASVLENCFKLVVIGEGDLRPEYENLVTKLGLQDKVEFLGRVDRECLIRNYQEAAIYILPSNFDSQEAGFTLTALEAMACGVPVIIAEGAGQVAWKVEEAKAGIRVKAGDALDLSQAIDLLLSSQELRNQMGRSARSLTENNYSWDDIAVTRRDIYNQALELSSRRKKKGRRHRNRVV